MSVVDMFPDKVPEKELQTIYPHKRQYRTIDGHVWEITFDRTDMITRKFFCEMKIDGKTYLVDRDSLMMMLGDYPTFEPDMPTVIETRKNG